MSQPKQTSKEDVFFSLQVCDVLIASQHIKIGDGFARIALCWDMVFTHKIRAAIDRNLVLCNV
jgi:enoyl-CoA hydratase/carnithine racemase